MVLYRPVGTKELELIKESNYRKFPPRLPDQPIFYPVLNEKYATEIASQWNVKYNDDHRGYVTRFKVDDAYCKQFDVQTVGDSYHQELWVPAEELETFNTYILNGIEVISEFGKEKEEHEKFFNSTQNTRPILPDSLRYIRSDVPSDITEEEICRLLDSNICTIIDLRQIEEREKKKCPLIDDKRFCYLCMPVTGGNAIPVSVNEVSESYIKMVDLQMNKIINTIMSAQSNVLFFCNAGKDRTGVVSAIILYKLGMSRDYIIRDYMASKANLEEMLFEYVKLFPEVDVNVITPQARYMEEFLDWLGSDARFVRSN